MDFFKFMNDSGVVGWLILFVGIGTVALTIERCKALYFNYNLNTDEFFNRIQSLVLAKRVDEAVMLCSQMEKKPLARAFKTILEKSDRDDDTIFQAHDIALSENLPLFNRKIHYLSMLANVATLMGLLGTIHGLIISFNAVAQADPSLKQALLANGISVSMYTTALGLAVAIPAMVFFSLLTSRQNFLIEQLQEKTSRLTELLTTGHVPNITRNAVFPENHRGVSTPPPPKAVRES